MKIIHLLPHNIYKFYPEYRGSDATLSKLDHHSTRFVGNLVKYGDASSVHELWTIGDVGAGEVRVRHERGFDIRVFPQDFNIFLPLETSFSMLRSVHGELRGKSQKTLWHVHSYYLWMFDFLVLYLAIRRQVIFAHHRGGGFTWKALPYSVYKYGIVLPILFRLCRKIFVQNLAEYGRIRKKYWISRSRIEYVPNPVKPDLLLPKRHPKENKGMQILHIGRMERWKGVFDLIEILSSIRKRFPKTDFHAIFVGSGSDLEAVRNHAHCLGVSDRITFAGKLGYGQIAEVLSESDLAIYGARKGDGMPNALVEMQSAGLPCVAFGADGPNDVIVPLETGFLVGTAEEYAEKLNQLLTDEELRGVMSEKAFRLTAERFSPESISKKVILDYEASM